MSRDYPDRAVWLAKRETNRKENRRGRLIWDSARFGNYVRKKHGPIGQGAPR